MKKRIAASAALCAMLAGVVWLYWPNTASDRVWAYEALPGAGYPRLLGDAQGYVAANASQGLALHQWRGEGPVFEVLCKGVRVMDVESGPTRLVIRMPADALWRAPGIRHLRLGLQQRLDYGRAAPWMLVSRSEPTWLEVRLHASTGSVPDEQRCLAGTRQQGQG